MYNTSKKQIWFGELRTSRGNTVVIHDNQLPDASVGRIFLYNTDRNAIVEYVEEIVKPNLYELDEAAIKAAETKFGVAWKMARADFLGKRMNVNELEDNVPVVKKPKVELETEDGYDNDYDDDDWSDDDYDDE
ncbi:hypothetical protein NFHSH190041_06690 [Shewanella sp. NFH-SH190041]|uniref:hypothetical protein n=1 Tax=Shewanella sp. NFH-SH190041 TaxID=2950245 RepID=UPI0021C278B5|nr:hypothetical protein [Shewanella sp. NFH-SH190041]BDM63217.1 hypothetical protein NFHSH190041_06690 [Shewanella sp. NFH-SH190041]